MEEETQGQPVETDLENTQEETQEETQAETQEENNVKIRVTNHFFGNDEVEQGLLNSKRQSHNRLKKHKQQFQ